MTGKPVYKPDEIRFALDLMVQDLFNDEISDAFRGRFSRDLTDNQIRYLRNKYGKDPDYGSPLINRQANKKLKRRRAALAAANSASPVSEYVSGIPDHFLKSHKPDWTYRTSPRPSKRARRESPTASTGLALPTMVAQQPEDASAQIPPIKFEGQNSPHLSSTPLFRAPLPQPQLYNQQSPIESPYILSPTQDGYGAGSSAQSWQMQPRTTFTTGFVPINTQFGQHDIATPGQGSPEVNNTTPTQTPPQPLYTQDSYGAYSTQQPSYGAQFSNTFPSPAPQQTVDVQSVA
ncbi:hypothetical protein NW762_000264 [Fusarium torreyae]|uniref:Uncharacterized protein n=1 Tax=Fusarium torreyae TaxID=1237075 RepID=A0A9W8SIY3_9HYPO|nr:hypothetical protein NW762_000264 [Fusarium torreyae]